MVYFTVLLYLIMINTSSNRVVLFRAVKGTHRWQFGQLNGKYCWWSHTTKDDANYRYLDSLSALHKLVAWYEGKGFEITEVI